VAVLVLLFLIIAGFSYITANLAISERQARKEMEALAEDLAGQVEARIQEGRLLALAQFLQAWHEERSDWTSIAGGMLLAETGSRENAAVRFLMDSRPLASKDVQLRQQLGPSQRAFAEFLIAEQHLKEGHLQEAYETYGVAARALLPTGEGTPSRAQMWLARWIRARRDELRSAGGAEEGLSLGSGDIEP
jgi:hypothetical protein